MIQFYLRYRHPTWIYSGKIESPNLNGCDGNMSGQNNQAGKSILKTDYSENNSIENNVKLAVKILLKTMDSTSPTADRFELSTIVRDADGDIVHTVLAEEDVKIVL